MKLTLLLPAVMLLVACGTPEEIGDTTRPAADDRGQVEQVHATAVKCPDPASPNCDLYPDPENPPTGQSCVYAVITNSRPAVMAFRYYVSTERNGTWTTQFSVDNVTIAPGEAKTYGPTFVPGGDYTLLTLRARYADGPFFDQKGLSFYAAGCPTGRFAIGTDAVNSSW